MAVSEQVLNQVAEILRLAARAQGSKSSLLDAVSRETGISFQKSISYKQLLKSVEEEGIEKDFCQVTFNASSFEEVASRYTVAQGLSLVSASEVLKIADYLSDDSITWRYDKSSASTAIMAIAQKESLKYVNECLSKLMYEDRIELLTRQNKKWVVGPLGITQAVEYRKAGSVWSIRQLFKEELPSDLVEEFVRQAQWIPKKEAPANVSTEYKQQRLIQLALTYGTSLDILSTFNKLITDGVLSLKTIRTYDWNIVGTPCGVFPKQSDGVNTLAQLIVDECEVEHLSLQLSQKNYFSSNVRLGSIEMCLRENPVSILCEFFGWADLIRIARNLDLVRPGSIAKSQLAEIIAIRLGFELPPQLEGMMELLNSIERSIVIITEPKRSVEELHGVMAGIYRSLEAFLKDILHFYIGFLWPESIGGADPGERRETFNQFCRQRFEIEKVDGVEGLTLGELVQLLHKLNNQVGQDPKLQNKLANQFRRKFIVPSKLLSLLEGGLKARKYLAHDKGQASKQREVITKVFGDALERIKAFLSGLKQRGYYPRAIRIQRQVTDEYGRQYVEALDEDGKFWLIYSNEYLETSESYFMHSITNYVAVDPYLSVRLR